MKRLTFLFGLLGAAVAKGQNTSTASAEKLKATEDALKIVADALEAAGEDYRKLQAELDAYKKARKPKSGYCPLDGSKGERGGYLYGETADKIINHAIEPTNPATFTAKVVLRCPHCGMLFTAITEKP